MMLEGQLIDVPTRAPPILESECRMLILRMRDGNCAKLEATLSSPRALRMRGRREAVATCKPYCDRA
jgi:hypothetical protein